MSSGLIAALSATYTTSNEFVADGFLVRSGADASAGLGLAAGGAYAVNIWTNSTLRARIASDGGVYMYALAGGTDNDVQISGTTSELRENTSTRLHKRNIIGLAESWLSSLWQLAPHQYKRINDERPEIGFIAEEVYAIEPRLVNLNADDKPYGLRHWMFTTLAIVGTQDNKNKIEKLKAEMTRLEDRIKTLEAA